MKLGLNRVRLNNELALSLISSQACEETQTGVSPKRSSKMPNVKVLRGREGTERLSNFAIRRRSVVK